MQHAFNLQIKKMDIKSLTRLVFFELLVLVLTVAVILLTLGLRLRWSV